MRGLGPAEVMKVRVETYEGQGGVDMLRRLYFDGREIEESSNLDQWHGADYPTSRSKTLTAVYMSCATTKTLRIAI